MFEVVEEFVLFVGVEIGENSMELGDFVHWPRFSFGEPYVSLFKMSRPRISHGQNG